MSGIMGNTVGTTMPRSDWAQTDPKKADYIKNKPDVEKAQKTADAAVKAAENAQTAADNARTTADAALPKTGGAMSGPLSVPAPTEPGHAVSKDYVDSKFTQIPLLWEHSSPASEIGKHDIPLNTDDELYLLEYYPYGTALTEFAFLRRGKTSRIKFFANATSPDAYTDIATRDITIEGGNMAITDAKVKSLNVTYVTTANGYLRPFRVFAVRGESV